MMAKTIGIPKAMYFFDYGDVWCNFFETLGYKVILSGDTDESILSLGIKNASSDLCLPIKTMFGHIITLQNRTEKADFIFLPKIYKTKKHGFTCPKTIGITDMVKSYCHNLPRIIDPEFYGEMKPFLLRAADMMGESRLRACLAYQKVKSKVHPGKPPEEMPLKVALIGHSYILEDEYLNLNIKQTLREMGVGCITPPDYKFQSMSECAKETPYKNPFWHSANQNLGFTKFVIDHHLADGIIYLNSFGCGTDSLSLPFCRDYIKNHSSLPVITVSIDEHRADAGILTRLEAFIDCLNFRLCSVK